MRLSTVIAVQLYACRREWARVFLRRIRGDGRGDSSLNARQVGRVSGVSAGRCGCEYDCESERRVGEGENASEGTGVKVRVTVMLIQR